MKHPKLLRLIPAALLWVACSENNSPLSSTPETPAALRAVAEVLFDLPPSIQSANPSVSTAPAQSALAKATALEREDLAGFSAYQPVPAYIHLGESIKDSVRALIQALAAADLPESYQGPWNGFEVSLRNRDSLFDNQQGRFFWLTLRRDTTVVLHLHYFVNARSQIRGACYFRVEEQQASVLVRFNTFNEKILGKRLSIWIARPDSVTATGEPSVLRLRAVETPRGRVLVSGISYHPHFDGDDFWSDEPKLYGFRAVANPQTGNAALTVAFADADQVNDRFYADHSLDKAVLRQAAKRLRERMQTDTLMWRIAFYSIEKKVALDDIFTAAHIAAFAAYRPERSADDFGAAELEQFLDVNATSILRGNDAGLKLIYFYAKVKQPIFLSGEATIVGYQGSAPASMDLTEADLSAVPEEPAVTDIPRIDPECGDDLSAEL